MTTDEMTVRVVPETAVDETLDARIKAALAESFPHDAATFTASRYWHGSAPAFTVLMEQADEIVAGAAIVDRTIRVNDTPVRVAGMQNVFVRPAHRGRGLSAPVMRCATDEAAQHAFEGGLLFCVPELEKVYAHCGWIKTTPREVVRVEDGLEKPLPGKNIVMFYPLRLAQLPAGRIHLCGNDW